MIRICFALIGSVLLALAPASAAKAVTIFAAASLGGALDEVVALWAQDHSAEIHVSYAGSGALARQIVAGAPADIYISAAPDWMDVVAEAGLIAEGPDGPVRVDLLGNSLVLIAERGLPLPESVTPTPDLPLLEMLGDGHLTMALVEAVPAGQYGHAALDQLGLWETVAPRVVQTENVRAASTLVARGEAPLGIVYATDALTEPRVRILGRFDPVLHPAITYPAAMLAEAPEPQEARAFFDFLTSTRAQQVFEAHGFSVLARSEGQP